MAITHTGNFVNSTLLIEQLGLEPYPEGGFFKRTYTAASDTSVAGKTARPYMTSIFYLLEANAPVGRMHSNRSDIVHYWQGGGALRYTLISPDGEFEQIVMGANLAAGEQLQLTVKGGWWKASELISGEYGLISEAVCPGFDYADHQFASPHLIQSLCPLHWQDIKHLC